VEISTSKMLIKHLKLFAVCVFYCLPFVGKKIQDNNLCMYGYNTLVIYIDGSAITNPGSKVGCAGIVEYPDYCNKKDEELLWSYNIGTSNSMELAALINALKWINKNQDYLKEDDITRIVILNDCLNIVNGCHWVFGWQKNKWKKMNGGTIKNLFLWKEYIRERQKVHFPIDVKWIEGKSGEQTKKVDKLAKKAAKSSAQKINFSHIKIKIGRSLSGKKFALEIFKAIGQTIIIRVCAHGVVNQSKDSEYEVRFEEIDNSHYIIGRFKAYTSREIDNKFINRGHFYYATFNNNLKHPWIKNVREIKGKKLEKIKREIKKILEKEK